MQLMRIWKWSPHGQKLSEVNSIQIYQTNEHGVYLGWACYIFKSDVPADPQPSSLIELPFTLFYDNENKQFSNVCFYLSLIICVWERTLLTLIRTESEHQMFATLSYGMKCILHL